MNDKRRMKEEMWDLPVSKRWNSPTLFSLPLLLLGSHCLGILSKPTVISFLNVTCHTGNLYLSKETRILWGVFTCNSDLFQLLLPEDHTGNSKLVNDAS